MGKSESRLGFKSRFGRFLGMIRQILGSIRHERLGFDLIRYFLGFDSKCGIRQPNLSQLWVLPFSVLWLFTSVLGELKIALHAVIVVRKMAAPTPCSSLSLSEPAAAVTPNVHWATSDNFPTLKVLAWKYYSIPATSASVHGETFQCFRLSDECPPKQTECLNSRGSAAAAWNAATATEV